MGLLPLFCILSRLVVALRLQRGRTGVTRLGPPLSAAPWLSGPRLPRFRRRTGDRVDRHVEREFERPARARGLREQKAALQRGDRHRREILGPRIAPERAAIAHRPQARDEMGLPKRKAMREHFARALQRSASSLASDPSG